MIDDPPSFVYEYTLEEAFGTISHDAQWRIKEYDGFTDGLLRLVNVDATKGTADFQWYDYNAIANCQVIDLNWSGKVAVSLTNNNTFIGYKFQFNQNVPTLISDIFKNVFESIDIGESNILVSGKFTLTSSYIDISDTPSCDPGFLPITESPDCDLIANTDSWFTNCEVFEGGLYARSDLTAGIQ